MTNRDLNPIAIDLQTSEDIIKIPMACDFKQKQLASLKRSIELILRQSEYVTALGVMQRL
eukprot:768562-Hanusia_phi.AAC.7